MNTSPCSTHATVLRKRKPLLTPGALAAAASCLFLASGHAASASLGEAASYGVLAADTITNAGTTIINGDVGLTPGTSITGFSPGSGVVNGSIIIGANAVQAQLDAAEAYQTLGLLMVTSDLTGEVLGTSTTTLTAGVYNFDTSAQLTGILTLDGPGEFIFLIGSTLTTASASSILLINGANMADVYFNVGSSATLGTNSSFTGTILAQEDITATTGANIQGRLLSLDGAVTLGTNIITVVPEPSLPLLALPALTLLLLRRGRKQAA